MKRTLNAITPLGDQLKFHSMNGREELGRLFEFRVSLLSQSQSISGNALLGKPFTVEIGCFGGAKRYLSGHCTRFAFTGKHTTGRYFSYDAIVRPTLWYATRGSDMKVFQGKKVPDIIKEVLGKYPIDLDVSGLSASYRAWDYCVQYRETDFNFVSRLMEHEGIYYYFKHSNGAHTLMLTDNMGAHPACPVTSAIPYYAPDTTYSDDAKDHFSQWLVTNAVDPGIFVTDEYDFKKPKADLSLNKNKTRGHSNASYEIYDFPGGYTELGDGEHYAQMRMDALQSGHELVSGMGEVRNAALGHTFSLTHHKRGDQNRAYLITAVDYNAQDNDYESDGSGAYHFSASVQALPTAETYRPKRLTPKPHTTGPESAKVVGPKGEEIYTDKYGRVKVQFHWDRIGTEDQDSSCWVRVSHPWAGSNFGAIHIPRIGQEVLIDFINGDPDRPIVTHRLYNEDNMPPWELPKNKTQSGIQTRWSKGGGGKHMLRFEDKKGIEHIELSTDHGNTHLHMGYLMNQGSEAKRSYGFELRTNEWGAVRADKGLLITTYTQDFKQKIAHENPDGHENMGASLSATEAFTKFTDQARSATTDILSAVIKNKGTVAQVTGAIASAVNGGSPAAAASAAISALTGGGAGGGGENAMPTVADPAMEDSKRMLGLSKKIDQPIVSIVSPEGQTMISPKPIVISSGQSVSIHAASNVTMKTGAQLSQLVQTGMYTHVASGGQLNVVSSGDIGSFAQAGNMNLVAKLDSTLASLTANTNVIGEQSVVISGNKDAVFLQAAQKIVLLCGGSSITLLADGTVEIKGKKGLLHFDELIDEQGGGANVHLAEGNVYLNCAE
jgi:type VI secretion system secreted protein VgrG